MHNDFGIKTHSKMKYRYVNEATQFSKSCIKDELVDANCDDDKLMLSQNLFRLAINNICLLFHS